MLKIYGSTGTNRKFKQQDIRYSGSSNVLLRGFDESPDCDHRSHYEPTENLTPAI